MDANWIAAAMLKLCRALGNKTWAGLQYPCSQDDLYDELGYNRAGMPPSVGGSYTGDYIEDWVKPRLARRLESVRKVKVPC